MLRGWWPRGPARWFVVCGLAVFGALLVAVLVVDKGPVGPDLTLTSGMHEWALDSSISFWSGVTHLGEVSYLLPAYLVVLAVTLLRRDWAVAIFVVLASTYSMVSYPVKVAVQRPRPPFPRADHLDPIQSFPSGHSGGAAAFAVMLFCVVAMSLPRWWRVLAGAVCVAIPILVGLSRVALGVHFPSDVLAGFSLALVWVLAVAYGVGAVRDRLRSRDRAPSGALSEG